MLRTPKGGTRENEEWGRVVAERAPPPPVQRSGPEDQASASFIAANAAGYFTATPYMPNDVSSIMPCFFRRYGSTMISIIPQSPTTHWLQAPKMIASAIPAAVPLVR